MQVPEQRGLCVFDEYGKAINT